MIRLKAFGGMDLRDADRELRAVLSQPKRLALLLRLAAEPPGTFLRRDLLLAMFWPELDTSSARNALRQALFHLRHDLGEGVLVSRGDEEVGLDPAQFESDVGAFMESASERRWQDMLELVRGELAPGLHVPDAAPFEEWLDSRRQEIHRRVASAAWQLSEEAAAAGAPGLAAGWARRALAEDPDDEVALRRLLRLLMDAGDHAGAAKAYAAFEERLRREYGSAPAAETAAAIRRGPPSGGSPPQATMTSGPPLQDATHPSPPAMIRPFRQRLGWMALGAALLLAMLAWFGFRVRSGGAAAVSMGSILIAPFETAKGDTALAGLAEGVVDLTVARLSGPTGPIPVDADAGLQAIDAARASGGETQLEQLRLAARRTGSGLALGGTLVRDGPRLMMAPWLLDVGNGRRTPLPQVGGPDDSLAAMVDRLVSALLAAAAGADQPDAPTLAEVPLPALQAYLEGREAMRRGDVTAAITAFGRAVSLDSTFALAARDYVEALDWVSEAAAPTRAHAWALRERLGARDRAILVAMLGRNFPAPTPARDQVADWEAALRMAPERSRSWFGLGDVLFHLGNAAGIPNAQDRARGAFDRALALDSASFPALLHRIEVAAREGEFDVVRRLAPRAEDPAIPGDVSQFLRWRIAEALGEPAEVPDTLSPFALQRIAGWGQLDGTGMTGPLRAVAALQRRAGTSKEDATLFTLSMATSGNRGRMAELAELVRGQGVAFPPTEPLLYAADASGAPAMSALERAVAAGSDTSPVRRREVTLWKIWEGGGPAPAEATYYIEQARTHPGDLGWASNGCLAAVRLGAPEAPALLRAADSLLGRIAAANEVGSAPLVLARCYEAAGDTARALATLARWPLDPTYGPKYLAGMLYHEGRLALATGDSARALRAWRHFLALRDDPDPALLPQRQAVQRMVDSLSGR